MTTAILALLLTQARIQRLHESPEWQALGHYKNDLSGGQTSEVLDEAFFLAKNGRHDPAEELAATLRGFFRDDEEVRKNPNAHPQCRFIARFRWLKKSLDWGQAKPPEVDCVGFRQWSFDESVESVSLVFATGYLGNPASFFGHPLLKFNISRKKVASFLLDTSVNYGAVTPPQENPVIYALKGLAGGYHATFSSRDFFYNSHGYSEAELRDMWDYELNLSLAEVERVVTHTWELLGVPFTYYFLTDNCASRMAEHLEPVLGTHLLPKHVPWAIPYTFFDSLAHKTKSDGTPIIRKFTYIPSRQARLRQKYLSLNQAEKAAVRAVAVEIDELEQESVGDLPPAERSRVLETLLDYYEFRAVGDEGARAFKTSKARVLAARIKLPPVKSEWAATTTATPPHQGQRPVLTGISALQSRKFKTGLELRFRPAYYDFLALDAGRPPSSNVAVLDVSVAYLDKRVRLQNLDLISVDTLNLSQTGLPGDGGFAWSLDMGFERQDKACTACSIFKIETGFGKAIGLFDDQIVYAMADGRIQTSTQNSGHLALTPNVGALLHFADAWKSMVEVGYRMYVGGTATRTPRLSWENRFGTRRDWDVRLSYERHVDQQAKVSFNYFW